MQMAAIAKAAIYCFDDFLPFLFGTENADTEINAVH